MNEYRTEAANRRLQTQEERAARIIAACSRLGIAPAEVSVYSVLHYGMSLEAADLANRASSESYRYIESVTKADCRTFIEEGLRCGKLRVVTETVLARLKEELRAEQIIGPLYGFPVVGQIDFDQLGARLWNAFSAPPPWETPPSFDDLVHEKVAYYFPTRAAAEAGIAELRGNDEAIVSVLGPTRIGPWRVQWWRRFLEGYRVDIEARRKWCGRSGSGGASSFLPPPRVRGAHRLRRILKVHQLEVAEWLFFQAMESNDGRSPRAILSRAVDEVARKFGVSVSTREAKAGLDRCVKRGWLRVVGQGTDEQVRDLLANDPVTLVVPKQVQVGVGEIDFAPAGAELYRKIAEEWLGPDWEDALRIEDQYYFENHYYSEAFRGFARVERFDANAVKILSGRLVAVGPWCVHWWERFPAGYRLELQVGRK